MPIKSSMAPPDRPRVKDLALERMLAALTVSELDLALIDLAWQAGLSPAIALWRLQAPRLGAGSPTWHPVRSRGPGELLPLESLVRSVIDGELDELLPGGSIVVVAPSEECGAALVLSCPPDGEAVDVAMALLAVYAIVAGPFDASFGAPLPQPGEPERGAGEDGAPRSEN